MLSEFETASGGVLIGSIDLISSDAVSFPHVNNVTFFRYPTKYNDFDAAVSRVSRPGQCEATKVHLIFTCSLEQTFFMSALEFGHVEIEMKTISEEVKQITEKI